MNNYTPNESSLIKILQKRKGKPINTLEIVDIHYPTDADRPHFARHSVVSVLNTLMEKVKKNKEEFRIYKSKRKGPYPSEYWIK